MMGGMKTLALEPARLMAEPDVARAVGVGVIWFDPMTRLLKFPRPSGTRDGVSAWDQALVKRWLARIELHSPSPSVEHLRWLVRRSVSRQSTTSIRATVGSWAHVGPVTTATALHLVRQVSYREQQDWAAARQAGATDLHIAKSAQVGTSLVGLVLDGIPKPLNGGRINPYLLQHLWEQGLPVAAIARTVDHSPERARREIAAAGNQLERRLNVAEVADRFGWTRTNVRGLRQPGRFPEPDSSPATVSGRGKGTWWWATTLERWAAEANLQTCPVCGGHFQRLTTHQRAKHCNGPRP